MKQLTEIQKQLFLGKFDFSHHAFKRAVQRNIKDLEIREAGRDATIIEDYPDDKYSPSCLLLGFTKLKRPLHIQVSRANTEFLKIITVYEPNKNEWVNYSQRR